MDIKEEDILGKALDSHWYYVAKGRALLNFLRGYRANSILDVGAGSGVFSRLLLDAGIANRAVCVDPNYSVERTDVHNGKPLRFVRALDEPSDHYGVTLMMDVIEHVDDDAGLIASYAGRGDVLITVPAFQFLWSGHDVFLEHRRRYTAKSLEMAIRKAGLVPVRTRYFFASLFPAIAAIRFLRRNTTAPKSDLAIYPTWLNKTLIAIHDVERMALFRMNRLFGLSIFCLCRRN